MTTTVPGPAAATDDNRIAVTSGAPSRGRIAVLTTDKVEEVEFFYPYYRFVEEGYDVDVITPSGGALTGARGFGIQTTMALADADPDDYLMLYIPGGHAPIELRANEQALTFVRAIAGERKLIGSVCHGPQVLISAGLVAGRTMTSWYGVEPEVTEAGGTWVNEAVVDDGLIVTARKPGDLPAEMHRIMQRLNAAA
ncbi:glutamine amidotransferase [Actinoplanes cyaneus]|uniref:Glutamine amidotransferase n=1 Tax=Actinoplanes cyaneus TaxID=52696 RepID=A0A919IN05_9ACTN|nr:type 1 glutamine amidotransferase domain-containing protein [Actinoplanes cyaneus]MCW2141716.1 PfpI peptidase, Cysteine peptidase, MEROPS family C56 [Actinoplanes cyaneus]GID68202.1 glutamine amidotransferase [Actinoplanes cyaneus]